MAASQTVPEVLLGSKSPASIDLRHGVITVYGYGISVYVERGHLTIEDGIGLKRRKTRLPRVGHGLRRLVLIGSDGFVSLSALRWLSDQKASFVMLERDGSVLAVTGPVYPSDARLRRAQSLASINGNALEISKGLIQQKLASQEQLARDALKNSEAADLIAANRVAIGDASTIDRVRLFESKAASA